MPRNDSALETYEGSCPICGLKLFLSADGKVVCLDEHYTADRAEFERIWKTFQTDLDKAGDVSDARVKQLLADLDALNQVEISAMAVANLRELALIREDISVIGNNLASKKKKDD